MGHTIMKIQTAILLSALFVVPSSVLAGAGAPVHHNHSGRTHVHSLPATGVNHNHNSGGRASPKIPQSKGWVYITGSGYGKDAINHYIKEGSLKVTNGNATVITKMNYDNKVNLYKLSVPLSHCRSGMGQMSTYTISGKHITSNDFVFGAGNNGSTMAEITCGAALKR